MPVRIRNIRYVGISIICEINDFVNSLNEIIDKVFDTASIDKIFVKLFKRANDFEILHRAFKKKVEN